LTPLAQFVVAFSAAICATAALGIWRAASEMVDQIERNTERAQRADKRSLGNRRHQSWLARQLLPKDEHRKPREFEPDQQTTDRRTN